MGPLIATPTRKHYLYTITCEGPGGIDRDSVIVIASESVAGLAATIPTGPINPFFLSLIIALAIPLFLLVLVPFFKKILLCSRNRKIRQIVRFYYHYKFLVFRRYFLIRARMRKGILG
jgi:hypothetical protein